ncbi:MAG: hypothetical protein HQL35_05660, partial [Alphaproteobacteria bacterium]|nr:hypothetical protein [Alphaproteobacteria bacterium]
RDDTGEPVMLMTLEQNEVVSLKFAGIKSELKLALDDADAKMLDLITAALDYVRELRIGDPVPSELTSGRASWDVTDQHRMIAHNRVTMQLVSWMSGDEMLITDPVELAQVVDDPKTKAKISSAFGEAAKALGIGEDRKEDVVSLIANLADELSFIEALRMQMHEIERMFKKVEELEAKYKSEMSVMEMIAPIKRLFIIALDGFHQSFDQVDAQTGEILSALTNIAQVTRFIRENRDDLHRRLWAWEDMIEAWSKLAPKRSAQAEDRLAELYRFLAQRFLPRNEWELFSQALEKMDKGKKRRTEFIW